MNTLKITTCLATNTDAACQAVVEYIGRKLNMPAEFVGHLSWDERERLLDAGRIHLGWICGLLYAWKADQPDPRLQLLAAPVMSGRRYQGRPVYFSDVVVRRDSPFRSFADLRGASWAYNEPRSYSGCHLVRYHLARLGETGDYFGRVVESGEHLASLQMVLDRQVDAAAIDSTIMDWVLARNPALRPAVRVVETLGPSPVPPWVVSRALPHQIRQALCDLLLNMHRDGPGGASLAQGLVRRFVPAADGDYDPIREVARVAAAVNL